MHLHQDAAQGPHVNGQVVGCAQEHLRRPVEAALDVLIDLGTERGRGQQSEVPGSQRGAADIPKAKTSFLPRKWSMGVPNLEVISTHFPGATTIISFISLRSLCWPSLTLISIPKPDSGPFLVIRGWQAVSPGPSHPPNPDPFQAISNACSHEAAKLKHPAPHSLLSLKSTA